MAKFNKGSNPTEDTSGNSRPFKVPGQFIHTGLQAKKAALEKFASEGTISPLSGPSTLHKPAHPKPPLAAKPSNDDKTEKDLKSPCLKPVAQRFGVQLQPTNRENDGKAGCTKPPTKTSDLAKEEPKPLYPKIAGNKFLNSGPHEKEKNPLGKKTNSNFVPQESEAKPAFSKVTAVKEKFMSATQENEPKPSFSKPRLAQKPSLNHEVTPNEDTSNKNVFLQKGLSSSRPNIHSFKAAKEMDENSNRAAEAAGSNFFNMALKPTGHWSSLSQGNHENVEKKTEEKEMNAAKNILLNKTVQEESGSSSKFRKMNTELAAGRSSGGSQEKKDGNRSSGPPMQKSLPPLFSLGQPPQKPSRPPSVDLEKFRKRIPKDSPKNEGLKQIAPSSAALSLPVPPPHTAMQSLFPPPASHPSLQAPAAPSLPPRNIKTGSETNFSEICFTVIFKPGQFTFRSMGKKKKLEKEEKRRMNQEKKEQKEKEKKEQEMRKKFKLTGPINVLHQARACVDHKGGKNELTVKQGDEIEVIRLTDNPEGKWLGRIKGCYGYIKTTMVEIDYDSLKRKQPEIRPAVKHPENDQVYDDVGEQDSISSQSGGQSGAGNMFPPPPSDQEIYDGIDDEDAVTRSVSQDEDKNGIWSWGILKKLKVKDDKKKSVREKTTKDCGDNYVYDDVDSSDFPPPPSELCLTLTFFNQHLFVLFLQFEGEIKVLYSTTTVQDLPQRKWGFKDLQIKPGESLEIIESTDDTKVLCRNEEGKCKFYYKAVVQIKFSESD
uniref:FYN binding protein 1 n=1 Tax=Falco tinnunculus TaxID=100819 RepID=A0A8C4TUQ2_FALTI